MMSNAIRYHRRKAAFSAILVFALIGFVFMRPEPAFAHPLGNFTINHYSRIDVSAGEVAVTYVLDMAEIPTFQEMDFLDNNGDGAVSEGERDAYLTKSAQELPRGLSLSINGSQIPLFVTAKEMELPPGQGGLPTVKD